uniref:Reverse transcriptase domain-containing protein n=1 Tax=Leptobrachium leishanense TaxID=445787 RepID=A0A8C5MF76_9ANUR
MLTAHVTLLPKPGKDNVSCSSYRPISLLKIDVKLFAKILANRLQPHVRHMIHPDQTSFIPGREARDNTARAIALIHHASTRPALPSLLWSTDADKACDRVSWPFLFATLRRMGLGRNMMCWISTLYSSPSARICVNGSLSAPLPVHNGTRQGCPLSPLLFALSLEPFLHAIRSNTSIHGFEVGGVNHKVATYADDLLFFVSQPAVSLLTIIAEFAAYGELSNLKINMNKSEILPLSISLAERSVLAKRFSFRWSTDTLTYLGIELSSTCSKLYAVNFPPLLNALEADLTAWTYSHVTWFGRIQVIKMNILPRVLYLLQTLPISVPPAFFKKLQTLFRWYVWSGKSPRIRLPLLTRPKSEGRVAMPHIRNYYYACHLQRIMEWGAAPPDKLWVAVEGGSIRTPLAVLPWFPTQCRWQGP